VGTTDALFAPLAARRVVAARKADLQAARNNVLLTVSQAFFQLQEARGRLLGITAAVVRAELLANFARELAPSLIAPLEVNRARTELQSLRQAQQLAVRDWRVASARLAEVLLLDPAALLEPIEPPYLQVTLISCERALDDMVAIALVNRPEITSRRELVAAANLFLKREKSRPFLPNLFVVSPATTTGLLPAGSYFAGANNMLNTNGSRFDIEVAAIWELQNAGLGNVGLIRQRRAERDLAAIDLTRILFRVRSEITQADARLQTARIRVVEAEEEVRQSVESADKNFIGLRQTTRPAGELLRLVVRPQEVVQAIEAMNQAYQQYASAISEYNAAQFDVYHALGQPAQFVTSQARDWMAPADAASNAAAASAVPAEPAPSPPPTAVSLSPDRPSRSR
jgi:outer membrane protein TolC